MADPFKRRLGATVLCLLGVLGTGAALAQSLFKFDLPRQSLADTLRTIGQQTALNIVFEPATVESIIAPSVRGELTSTEAIRRALAGTKLAVEQTDPNTLMVAAPQTLSKGAGYGMHTTTLLIPGSAQGGNLRLAQVEPNKPSGTDTSAAGNKRDSAAAETGPARQDPNAEATSRELEEVTVSASRIERSGFQAPTPVSVIGVAQIDQRGTTNIANIINEMPAFTGTITPSSTNLNSRQNGINAVDLRGLGPNRNLVLLNGRRGTPFDEFGDVDLNAVPSLAIQRVEVVTGGASAAWGSDAVSGVVNLIYDETLQGLKFNAQYGQSAESDTRDTRFAAAWGTDLNGGTGHLLLAADYNKNTGIPEGRDRDWQLRSPALVSNTADTGPNDGIPALAIRDNAVLFLASPNGVTLPLGIGASDNLEFFPNGTAQQRQLGDVVGNFMIGGSGSRLGDRVALFIPVERYNVLASAQQEITDQTKVFAEASFAQSKSSGKLIDVFSLGDVTITPDNPYLPADVAALNESFPLFRTFEEFDPITSVSKNESLRLVAGLKGKFGGTFSWEVSGQYGRNEFSNDQPNNLLVGNLLLAADAVFDPSVNRVVCRANLGGANGAPGCSPINMFGKGSPSAAAIDYITATGESDTEITQTAFAAHTGGELFDAWAGPVLGTVGAEYREEKLDRKVNAPNENEEFAIVNAQPLTGKFDVKEVFAEVAVPLLEGTQSLDFDAAARFTDYSTIGSVSTWKLGLVYSPVEPLRFRGSVSRDIRAPSIGETFVKNVLLFTNISNPFTGDQEFIQSPTRGNTNLTEESALTTTFGVVYSSGGFKASVDWYHIDLQDTIGVLTPQDVVDRCFAGESALCALITFNPDQSVDSIIGQNLNLGTFDLRGIDSEMRYTHPLGGGNVNLGLMASYLIHKNIAPSGGTTVDSAGELGGGTGFGTPDFKATVSAGYEIGNWAHYAQLRFINDGVFNATYTREDLSDDDNRIPSITYLDLSTRYDLKNVASGELQIFAGIDNVLDKDPPVVPLDFIANSATNAVHYDVIGRKYYVGVRMKF